MRALVDVDGVVELTKALVAVDTRNPPGGERPIAGVVREALDRWRPVWTEVEPSPGRLSLVARLSHPEGERPGRKTMIVNGHLDVVPVQAEDWARDPFDPHVEDGKLYGRGSADMKGGIAAAICALDVLERGGRAPACDVVFHLVADEEMGGALGTRVLLQEGLISGDACLVPEPTDLQLCIAERGLLQGYVTVTGRPGHGSRPHDAVSAVEHAARLVLALHGADFGDAEHPLLGRPSANVGIIDGGTAINVVAGSCRFSVDRRLLPGVSEPEAEKELLSRIEGVGVPQLRYAWQQTAYAEASELPASDQLVAAVGNAVERASGARPQTIGMTFTTDARMVRNQAGIPTVVCGPGAVEQAHTTDEFVPVERLVDATAAYAELLASYG
ncbi:MAG: M20 family metallopeptidase [Acidimicrobiaceae bacterium]|nr:M20 family metallopeptidase [Acidimicrobiaceae bacterium]